MYRIGVDLGGTNIVAGVLSHSGQRKDAYCLSASVMGDNQ